MPITQTELADSTGSRPCMSTAPSRRCRAPASASLEKVLILDLKALQVAALFKANYLHLDFEEQEIASKPRENALQLG